MDMIPTAYAMMCVAELTSVRFCNVLRSLCDDVHVYVYTWACTHQYSQCKVIIGRDMNGDDGGGCDDGSNGGGGVLDDDG